MTPEVQSCEAPVRRLGPELLAWMRTLVSAAVYATVIVTFGAQVARVEGESMMPTLEDEDRLVVNKAVYQWSDPKIGDVVMHYAPHEPNKTYVKRVVAAAGDTIESVNGRIYRNGALVNESFIPDEYLLRDTWGPVVVKPGYYFVLGDHRNNSSDSRQFDQVPKKYIVGKVQLRWWPPARAKIF